MGNRRWMFCLSQLFAAIYHNIFGCKIDVCICEEYLDTKREGEYSNINFIPIKGRNRLDKYLIPFTGILHRHNTVVKDLLSQKQYEYCIFDHNSIAGSLVDVCRNKGIKTIVLNHNFEYDYFRDNNSYFNCLLLLPQIKKNERKSYLGCNYNIFLTKEDKEQFANVYGKSKTISIVGGCFNDKNYISETHICTPFHKNDITMIISGTMGNVQNLDGINYFLDELYPLVPQNVKVIFAGKNPPNTLVSRLNSLYPRVELKSNPQNMDEIVNHCEIFLCPARLGGGMKLRVMDGLRNGLPVLAHEVSSRGYRDFEREGILYSFSNKTEFSQKLMQIIENLHLGRLLRKDIMTMANDKFSFDTAVSKIKSYL